MKLRLTFLILLSTVKLLSAQNLVANNSFETFSATPTGPGEWWKATGWNNVNNVASFAWPYASPDYLSTLGSGSAQLPNSVFGTVSPYSGNAVFGLVAYYAPSVADYREYISRQLSSAMIAGQVYTVSFMITNGRSNQYCGSGCNHIGVCFSTSPLTQAQHEPINVVPQVEISTVLWDTAWHAVSFTFTPSAAYQYITIGNFYNDASTSHTVYRAATSSPNGAYYFIDDVNVSPASPMPVELISFTGKNNNGYNVLQWSTASEINNHYFSVQRSKDAEHFSELAKVEGRGNSTELSFYSYTDNAPSDGINYYRLQQVDINGAVHFSETIAIHNSSKDKPCLLMTKEQQYYINCISENSTAEIYDLQGRLCHRQYVKAGENAIIDLSQMPGSLFMLRITSGDKTESFKLVK